MARVKIEKGRVNLVNTKNLDATDTEVLLVRSQPSIEISRNAKGAFSYCVKVYADDTNEALEKAIELANKLNSEFSVEE